MQKASEEIGNSPCSFVELARNDLSKEKVLYDCYNSQGFLRTVQQKYHRDYSLRVVHLVINFFVRKLASLRADIIAICNPYISMKRRAHFETSLQKEMPLRIRLCIKNEGGSEADIKGIKSECKKRRKMDRIAFFWHFRH